MSETSELLALRNKLRQKKRRLGLSGTEQNRLDSINKKLRKAKDVSTGNRKRANQPPDEKRKPRFRGRMVTPVYHKRSSKSGASRSTEGKVLQIDEKQSAKSGASRSTKGKVSAKSGASRSTKGKVSPKSGASRSTKGKVKESPRSGASRSTEGKVTKKDVRPKVDRAAENAETRKLNKARLAKMREDDNFKPKVTPKKTYRKPVTGGGGRRSHSEQR